MNKILIFSFASMLMISSLIVVMPGAYATDDFKLEYSCGNENWNLKITDSEGNPLSNVSVYLLNAKREFVRSYVADENGLLDIPKSEMSESVKISKGGFNDQLIFPNCYLTKQDVRELGDYMGGDAVDTNRDIIDFCDNNYEMYTLVGPEQFKRIHESTAATYVRSCIKLYQSNVYPYDGPDRIEVFINYLNKSIGKQVSKDQESRIKDVEIPVWVKNNAKWWVDGTLDDQAFVGGIQFLIKEGIIQIPETTKSSTPSDSQEIPSWIKNNADWWSQGLISDNDFLKGIQFMVENGIITV